MRSRALGQNFLRNRRTARRVAHLAGDDHDLLCVDLGAGNGSITEACLLRAGPILAIEVDERLVRRLRTRFADEPRISVREADLMAVAPPEQPFVIAANPPFNLSTKLVRRWLLHDNFRSGALIVEKPFARRVSGDYGATKLSLSMGAYLDMQVPFDVRAAEFQPRPQIDAAILTAVRRSEPEVPWSQRSDYWTFVNHLFERGRATAGEALQPLGVQVPQPLRKRPLRELAVADAVALYCAFTEGSARARRALEDFEAALPGARRVALGDVTPFRPRSPRA
jgi:23S rRNA (adenine-N6)-dimethyltransferase